MEHADVLISAISGGALTALLAKYVISKTLADLNQIAEKVIHINQSLATMAVRLEKLEDHETSIKEHASRIARIEGFFYDDRRQVIHS